MRRIFVFLVFVFAASALHAQSWVVIDGVPATPVRVNGNITPTVQKLATGVYKVTMAQPSHWVLATSATVGDAASTIVSIRFDAPTARVLIVTVYGVGVAAGGATSLRPVDGRFSLEVRPGS